MTNLNDKDRNSQKVMDLEREVQALRLELDSKDKLLATVQHDLSMSLKNAEEHVEREANTRLEQLFSEIATPVAQLVTQDYMFTTQSKQISAKDVLFLSTRIISRLKNYGLEFIGSVGESVPFCSSKQESLSLDQQLKDGEPSIVRMVGVSFNGKILRRAAVTRMNEG